MAMTEARFFIKGKSVSAEEFARHFNLKPKKGGKRSGYSIGKGKMAGNDGRKKPRDRRTA